MRLSLVAAAALVGVAFIAMPSSASAASIGGVSKNLAQQAQSGVPSLVQKVQRRGRGRRARRRGRGNAGAAAAGAAIGLFLGAVAADQAARHRDAVEWCMRRYRSYDPETETWIDRHGRVRHCP